MIKKTDDKYGRIDIHEKGETMIKKLKSITYWVVCISAIISVICALVLIIAFSVHLVNMWI